jgi:hypothetical protein
MDFPGFNFQQKNPWTGSTTLWTDDVAGSTMDRRWCRQEVRRRLAGARHVGAWGHRCSPTVAREDEEDEAKPVRDSPKHERWRGGGATEAKSNGGLGSVREWRKTRENSGVRGKGAGCSRGGGRPFIGAQKCWEAATSGRVMTLMPLMAGAELRAVMEEF